jgi:hypothetical protein
MTAHGIVMLWKSNEAWESGQKPSENVRRSFMFHYPFLEPLLLSSGANFVHNWYTKRGASSELWRFVYVLSTICGAPKKISPSLSPTAHATPL